MNKLKQNYIVYLKDRKFLWSFAISIFVLALSLCANYYAGLYAVERASNAVTDIVLSNVRVFDVDDIFVYGPLILWTFVIFLLLYKPRRIPFVLKSVALFTLIRSVFVSLTHLGPFPTHSVIPFTGFVGSFFNSGADLFFSGHTGLPFLLALIFWQNKRLRVLFIALSLLFGTIVLLGHLHYSIDVLSAFFITYTIYHIAERLFRTDKKMFDGGEMYDSIRLVTVRKDGTPKD